jgi:hypothetical protein
MRLRFLLIAALPGALLAAVAPAAHAAPPHGGCPSTFTLAPVSVLGTDFTGVADNVNHDGMICIRELPSGKIGIFIDNTAP